MLLIVAGVPLVASVLLGLGAAWTGRRLPPATAAKVLSSTAFLTALAAGFCMSVVAFNALARIPLVAALGQWSASALGLDGTFPPLGGVLLGVVVICLLITSLTRSVRTATDLAAAVVTARRLPDLSDGLVLLHDPTPDAFALPGLRGKIVVTTSMLKALTPAERRALIAHEQAHLANHHQLYIQAANLAAAANPLLIPVARQVRLLVERWADEEAALAVDDRLLAARALAKAALARCESLPSTTHTPRFALASTEHAVTQRALALTRPLPTPRRSLSNAVLGLAGFSLLASAVIAHSTEAEFEHAHHTYLTHSAAARTSSGSARPQPTPAVAAHPAATSPTASKVAAQSIGRRATHERRHSGLR